MGRLHAGYESVNSGTELRPATRHRPVIRVDPQLIKCLMACEGTCHPTISERLDVPGAEQLPEAYRNMRVDSPGE